MKSRLLVALAAGLMVGSNPAPDLGEVIQLQVVPPGSRWVRTDDGGLTWVEEFGRDGVWRSVCSDKTIMAVPQSYTLNPAASPPRIDLTWDGRKRFGIYRLEGDRLLICMGETRMRPTTFAHRPNARQWLFVYKRLK